MYVGHRIQFLTVVSGQADLITPGVILQMSPAGLFPVL